MQIVVTGRRPYDPLLELIGILVEHIRLIFRIRTVVIGVVSQPQPYIGMRRTRIVPVGIADCTLVRGVDAEIAGRPNPHSSGRSDGRMGIEIVAGITLKGCRGGADRIEVLGIWRQARQLNDVLRQLRRIGYRKVEAGGAGSITHPCIARDIGPPANENAAGIRLLQIRSARNGKCCGRGLEDSGGRPVSRPGGTNRLYLEFIPGGGLQSAQCA